MPTHQAMLGVWFIDDQSIELELQNGVLPPTVKTKISAQM